MGDTQRVNEILGQWWCLGPLEVQEVLNERRTVFRVTGEGESAFILKQVDDPERAGGIESQAGVLHHLQASGVPVAATVPTDASRFYALYAGSLYTLSPHLPGGTHIAGKDLLHAHCAIGRAIAHMHCALASYPFPIPSWQVDLTGRLFDETVPRLELAIQVDESARFRGMLAMIEMLMRVALADLPVQRLHGDLHVANILLQDGEVSGFIDLDHLPLGPPVYDLGYVLADIVKRRVGSVAETERWRAFSRQILTGYSEIQQLSLRERRAIWPVMLAVQLLFVEFFLGRGGRDEGMINLEAWHWLAERWTESRFAAEL